MPNDKLDADLKEQLQKEDLNYTSDKAPGFFRQKNKKTFIYYDLKGKIIRDKETLERIKSLCIPPAWKNVWICPKASGHLQATGIDDRKRKQYIYHPDWIKISQENKFSKVIDFGLNLPKIRGKVNYNLGQKKMDKTKILSTVIWLLEHTLIRVGNEEYSKQNKSFGLTTLRNKHVKQTGKSVVFSFKGKSGVYHVVEISNKTVAKTIRRCIEIPGYELFGFIDDKGDRHVISSEDVNSFLKNVTHEDFSAKDFRTWGGTSISAKHFYKKGFPEDKKLLKKNVNDTIKVVAHHLNNTVSVCKNYYIHPTVIKSYEENILVPHFETHHKSKIKKSGLSLDEYALINLLQKNA